MRANLEGSNRAAASRALLLGLLAILLAQAPGCSCRSETPAERSARIAREEAERIERERKRAEEEKRRQPIVLDESIRVMPAGDQPLALAVKPGHWNAVRQSAKANAEDFDGEFILEPRGVGVSRGRLATRRPLVVAKESEKSVDSLFYMPAEARRQSKLSVVVKTRRSGARVFDFDSPVRPLLEHQYHWVVLAREPQRYGFLTSLYSVTSPAPTQIDTAVATGTAIPVEKNFHVVPINAGEGADDLALPDSLPTWTTIAYVLWDEVDPALLTPAQRDAMLDWLNWGGQLIVSGPNSLDLLRGSFLEPFLPAADSGTREITSAELARFGEAWRAGRRGKGIDATKPWTGVRLDPQAGSQPLPGAAGLVVEGRVGRGRIVVTAFDLSDPRLLAWSRGVDNFFNAGLLRRPPRRFVGRSAFDDSDPGFRAAVQWADRGPRVRYDPRLNTRLRMLVRDAHADPDTLAITVEESTDTVFPSLSRAETPGGVAAVNDFNTAGETARSVLRESAGVSVPGAGFVVACLLFYLLFLVPANWGLFAALGRVELAWVAAPIIALVGAWVVIQQAQLDIGFVRARTEVAVLELQPDTPRGLLTRFTALYTSLSTTYEMEFDNPAVAQPFARGGRSESFGSGPRVSFERLEKSRLRNVAVSSASAEFIRSEEMLGLDEWGIPGSSMPGSLRLVNDAGSTRLVNRTQWTLEDVMVVGRPDGFRASAPLEGCWVGELRPGERASVAFFPIAEDVPHETPFQRERADAARVRTDEASWLSWDGLLSLAINPEDFEPGERRVIARLNRIIPGLSIEPSASQRTGATLVVGHLNYGLLPPPKTDVNGPLDVN